MISIWKLLFECVKCLLVTAVQIAQFVLAFPDVQEKQKSFFGTITSSLRPVVEISIVGVFENDLVELLNTIPVY